MLAGGWTKLEALTEEDRAIFNKALNGLLGVLMSRCLLQNKW